jgi:restriction system protein
MLVLTEIAPMPSRYPYQVKVRNKYLGVSKVIRATTEAELDWLAEAQRSKWAEQEQRKRQQQQKEAERAAAKQEAENLRVQAEEETRAAQQKIDAYRSILAVGLAVDLALDWDQLLDRAEFPPFRFTLETPDRDQIRRQVLGPEPQPVPVAAPVPEEPSFFEAFLPFLRRRRLERQEEQRRAYENKKSRAKFEFEKKLKEYRGREATVIEAFNRAASEYNARLKAAKNEYIQKRQKFLAHREAHNNAVLAFRERYSSGSAEAVEQYARLVLDKSAYPDGIPANPDFAFDEASKTLVINFWLPGPDAVPRIVEHKYIASRKTIKLVEMKAKDFEAFYDDVIHQITLRTVHEVYVADRAQVVDAVVFNGWVQGTDAKTGKPFTSCIITCEVSRQAFAGLDLAKVSPKECVRGLKGVTAGPLAMLAPVKPIMDINREDDRFIESREVLSTLKPEDNLASMEWEDFEHLVRELFEKEFRTAGAEVRVTQASRDRGVDAIAFDPEPIRGGKFVIQAKRYNMVVPVSAVRDLYGTMIAEGATKGILVTTSHFGRDSLDFAKDKPITLIDGARLVYMPQKHGRNVHIALLPKGDPRRGL